MACGLVDSCRELDSSLLPMKGGDYRVAPSTTSHNMILRRSYGGGDKPKFLAAMLTRTPGQSTGAKIRCVVCGTMDNGSSTNARSIPFLQPPLIGLSKEPVPPSPSKRSPPRRFLSERRAPSASVGRRATCRHGKDYLCLRPSPFPPSPFLFVLLRE